MSKRIWAIVVLSTMLGALSATAETSRQTWITDLPATSHYDQTDLGKAMAICDRFRASLHILSPQRGKVVMRYDDDHWRKCDPLRAQWQNGEEAARQKAAADKAKADEDFLDNLAKGNNK